MVQVIESLLQPQGDLRRGDIGVVSPYSGQVRLLADKFKSKGWIDEESMSNKLGEQYRDVSTGSGSGSSVTGSGSASGERSERRRLFNRKRSNNRVSTGAGGTGAGGTGAGGTGAGGGGPGVGWVRGHERAVYRPDSGDHDYDYDDEDSDGDKDKEEKEEKKKEEKKKEEGQYQFTEEDHDDLGFLAEVRGSSSRLVRAGSRKGRSSSSSGRSGGGEEDEEEKKERRAKQEQEADSVIVRYPELFMKEEGGGADAAEETVWDVNLYDGLAPDDKDDKEATPVAPRIWSSTGDSRVKGNIEVRSVDGYQGREKDAIVFSAVRSNRLGRVGFLKDWRRLNVALTRARNGIIGVGDSRTLCHEANWRAFIEWTKAEGVFIDRQDK